MHKTKSWETVADSKIKIRIKRTDFSLCPDCRDSAGQSAVQRFLSFFVSQGGSATDFCKIASFPNCFLPYLLRFLVFFFLSFFWVAMQILFLSPLFSFNLQMQKNFQHTSNLQKFQHIKITDHLCSRSFRRWLFNQATDFFSLIFNGVFLQFSTKKIMIITMRQLSYLQPFFNQGTNFNSTGLYY